MSTLPFALQSLLDRVNNVPETNVSLSIVREASAALSESLGLPKVPVALVLDYSARLATHDIIVRCDHPTPSKTLPAIFFYHGGGHVSCSLETHDRICRRIANATQCVVLSVDYRLAPEFPYPCGVEDCLAITAQRKQLFQTTFPVDFDHIFLAGDSAGGNLALTVCHQMQQHGDTAIQGLLLIYPSVDFSMNYDSFERYGRGFLLTKSKVSWYLNQYFAKGGDRKQASPIHFPNLESLPPVYLAIAELDPLYDENQAFATKLQALGVTISVEEFKGMIHAFVQFESLVPLQISQLIISIRHFIQALKPL